jgi:hypothetical protein
MKKLIAVMALFVSLSVNAQTTTKWPFGAASNVTLGAGATNNVTLVNGLNYVGTIPTLTANTTVSVTVESNVKAGAILLLSVKTTSTETTTFTGAIVAPVVTGVSGKTWSQAFIYNGTTFYPCGAKIQVD